MNRMGNILLGSAAITLAVGAVMSAQAPVTMTLRSGETVAVTLVDLGGRGFEVRVNGAERLIPRDQVALVDFGPVVPVKQAWFAEMTATTNLVVFKNGDTLLAEWADVGGTSPLVLRFNTGSGEREISANDVARIYLVAPAGGSGGRSGGAAPARGGMQPDGSVAVLGAEAWTNTGLTVRTGEYLRFAVSGEIRFGTGASDNATADGNTAGTVSGGLFRRVPVPSLPVGGLIGKVGNGAAFSIGTAPLPIRMPANGQLMLGINDLTFNDNSGWFRVVITR